MSESRAMRSAYYNEASLNQIQRLRGAWILRLFVWPDKHQTERAPVTDQQIGP